MTSLARFPLSLSIVLAAAIGAVFFFSSIASAHEGDVNASADVSANASVGRDGKPLPPPPPKPGPFQPLKNLNATIKERAEQVKENVAERRDMIKQNMEERQGLRKENRE